MKRVLDYIRFKRLGSKNDSRPILLGKGRVPEIQREVKKKRISRAKKNKKKLVEE